jgi:hypothetical protein
VKMVRIFSKSEYINAVQNSKNHFGANDLSVTVIRLISNRKCHEKCVLFAPQWFFLFLNSV